MLVSMLITTMLVSMLITTMLVNMLITTMLVGMLITTMLVSILITTMERGEHNTHNLDKILLSVEVLFWYVYTTC